MEGRPDSRAEPPRNPCGVSDGSPWAQGTQHAEGPPRGTLLPGQRRGSARRGSVRCSWGRASPGQRGQPSLRPPPASPSTAGAAGSTPPQAQGSEGTRGDTCHLTARWAAPRHGRCPRLPWGTPPHVRAQLGAQAGADRQALSLAPGPASRPSGGGCPARGPSPQNEAKEQAARLERKRPAVSGAGSTNCAENNLQNRQTGARRADARASHGGRTDVGVTLCSARLQPRKLPHCQPH